MKPYVKYLKILGAISGGSVVIAYNVSQTYRTIGAIVNTSVLDRERKSTPEYIYIEDPHYDVMVKRQRDREKMENSGLARIWKSLKHTVAWRLLWICRHGNRDQRNMALEQLAAFKKIKDWDYMKLAQALDEETAVLLARTRGADLRFFLPPPLHIRRAASSPELLSMRLLDMLIMLRYQQQHSCIDFFLSKYYSNVQEQAMESDNIPSKPDTVSERQLCLYCLDALHHHLTVFADRDRDITSKASGSRVLVAEGMLSRLAELLQRYPGDGEVELAALRVMTSLSVHTSLLKEFFQNGLLRSLSAWLRSPDVRLACSANVCLVNLSGEQIYWPGLFLLHPLYRSCEPTVCDALVVHGLRGGVFVTWRQRDRNSMQPLGLFESVMTSRDDALDYSCVGADSAYLSDPDLRQVIEDLQHLEDETLLASYDLVLHDMPEEALREPPDSTHYTSLRKREALQQEEEDGDSYTSCWPKDWLPQDCSNIRVVGVNYSTSVSDWLPGCALEAGLLAERARWLAPALRAAGVGVRDQSVVWLAHSMGGLIVKQLLVDSSQGKDPSERQLSASTRAVLFFSTPHRGSSLATMPRGTAALFWPSTDVRQLQEDSPVLLKLHQQFLTAADSHDWETISFAESKPTLVSAFKVPVRFVEGRSADLGRGVFYKLPLDHLSICKPATRQSILYTTVVDVLRRATERAKDTDDDQNNNKSDDVVPA